MNNIITGTLALAALGTLATASPDPQPTSTDSEWARLDREIGDLANSVRRNETGTNVGGLIRTYYMHSNDSAFDVDTASPAVNSGKKLGGFGIPDADVYAEGSVADIDWRINFGYHNAATNNAEVVLEDAYGRIYCENGIGLTLGMYKAPLLHSNRIYPENQVLPWRTFSGQILDVWDAGVMVTGDWKSLGGFVSVQNGLDQKESKLLYSSRLEYRLFGGTGRVEGAFGASDDLRATFGGMWLHDSSNTADGSAVGVDANATMGPFAIHGEVVRWDGKLLATQNGGGGGNGGTLIDGNSYFGRVGIPINYGEAGQTVSDANIWSTTVSYFIAQSDVELALRLEGFDDPGNTTAATIGANWYRNGKNAVWYVGLTQVSSNDHANAVPAPGNGKSEGIDDATLLMIGLSLGSSTSSL